MTRRGGPGESSVRFSCAGHPAVRATHDATIELTLDRAITARATCVVGVGASVAGAELAGYVGPVSITLRAGSHEEVVRAIANPGFQLVNRMVIRRSGYHAPETFAIGADKGARDLSRELVREMVNSEARLLVTVRGTRLAAAAGSRALVVAAVPGDLSDLSSRALLSIRSAQVIVAEPAIAHRLRGVVRGAVVVRGREASVAGIMARLRAGEPVVLACPPRQGPHVAAERRLLAAAVSAGIRVDPLGFTPEVGALLASGFELKGALVLIRTAPGRVGGRLDWLPPDAVLVWRLPRRVLADALAAASEQLGDARACCVLDAERPGETAVLGTILGLSEVARSRDGAGESLLVLTGEREEGGRQARSQVYRLVRGLAADGVSKKVLVRALVGSLGWRRGLAYQVVHGPGQEGGGQGAGGEDGGE